MKPIVDRRWLGLLIVATAGVLGFWLATTLVSFGQTSPGDGPVEPSPSATRNLELERGFVRPKEMGTPVYHRWQSEEWRPIIGEQNWKRNVVDDANVTAVTDPEVLRDVLSAHQDYPLYWVGDEFQGLPLTSITLSYRPHVTPAQHHVVLSYGTCVPPRGGGCSVPLQIRVEPYCYAQPGMYAVEAKEGGVFQLRGADAQFIAEGLRIWMSSVSVRIAGHSEELVTDAAQALVTANARGPGSSDEPFPPLDTDCSDFTLEPLLGG